MTFDSIDKLRKVTEEARKTLYLAEAGELMDYSECSRVHFGCVIVKDNNIIGRGFNKPLVECDTCIREVNKVEHGSRLEICTAIHAEMMAIIGVDNKCNRADLYLVGKFPDGTYFNHQTVKFGCSICLRFMLQVGIKNIYIFNGKDVEHSTPKEALMNYLLSSDTYNMRDYIAEQVEC